VEQQAGILRVEPSVIHTAEALLFAAIPPSAAAAAVARAALILLGTFVLEDAATVFGAMQVAAGQIPLPWALGALYAGIVLGDIGLYGMGWLAVRLPWAARLLPADARLHGRAWLSNRLVAVVFASRFLPGARLPTYTACGFVGASLARFALASVAATLVWTSLLFGVSLKVGALLLAYLGPWRWAGAAGFALTIMLIGRGVARLRTDRP
jgi:membrane protein DedA with SNARE-associated domain